jgi:hypothetical protein
VGELASGDGVTNDGTVSGCWGTSTVVAEGVLVSGVVEGLPSGYRVLAPTAPVAGIFVLGVPGTGVVAPGDAVTEPGVCVDGAAPSCASTTGAPPALPATTTRSMHASFPTTLKSDHRPASWKRQ